MNLFILRLARLMTTLFPLVLLIGKVEAQTITGKELLERCKAGATGNAPTTIAFSTGVHNGFCYGFISGVVTASPGTLAILPQNIELEQIGIVVIEYLEGAPQLLQRPAMGLVRGALMTKFFIPTSTNFTLERE